MTKFNVVINPFSGYILIWARVNKVDCDVVLDWDFNKDAWQPFEFNNKSFIIHIDYEDELFVGIYDDNDEAISSPYPTTFKITHKDEF